MNELETKSMLFGFMYGDGWISHVKNEKYNHFLCGFSGDVESLEVARKDLTSLYGDIGKATINTRKTSSYKYNIYGTTSSFCVNTKVAKDFISLGMPIGKKVEQKYSLPDWITCGSKNIKASFLSGLYAAEGYTPSMQQNNKTAKVLGLNITKRTEFFEDFKEFISQISAMLNELEIEHTYKFKDTFTCDHNKKAIITFNNSNNNVIKTASLLNIKYSVHKNNELKMLSSYLELKEFEIKRLEEAYALALQKNCSAKSIAEKFNITKSQVENWRRRETKIRIPNNFITFDNFKKTYGSL